MKNLFIQIKIVMKRLFINTNEEDYSPAVIRLLLGIVFFPHGAQKLLGWFGGVGFESSMTYFTQQVGLPYVAGMVVIFIEFFGSLFLVLGFATRLWGLGILAVSTGIILTTFNDYFFMNWFGNQKEEGYEFFLLMIGMSISLIISGGGKFSMDALLQKDKLRRKFGHTTFPA
jgi:putative oxidoreductase